MTETISHIPDRFRLARKYERTASYVTYAAMAGVFVGFLTNNFWLALLIVFIAMPAAWLFNIRCYRCSWPAYRVFGVPAGWRGTDPLFARTTARLPQNCSKCQVPFDEGRAE